MSETTLNKLLSSTQQILNKITIDPDLNLADIGIDSMNVVQLILSCDEIYNDFVFEKLKLDELTTLRQIDQQLTAEQGL